MAHSYVSSHELEIDAFRNFVRSFPERSILLIDTYDTIAGARNAAEVGKEMEALGQRLQGVRLDSGDFDSLSRQVRVILDKAGLQYTRIVASGGLDESDIHDLVSGGAPIDVFGIGTKMGVSADAPWSDMAYKLVEYDGRPVLKLSTGKASLPGEKQVFRLLDDNGDFSGDIIALRGERVEGGEPLLCKVMEQGKALRPLPSLDEMRGRFKEDFGHIDDRFKALQEPPAYEVALSPRARKLYDQLTVEAQSQEKPNI